MNYWFYLNKELSDISDQLQQIFGINSLQRDYENHWEWLEGKSEDSTTYINVSRPHNWKTGEYNEPIRIRLEMDVKNENELNLIQSFGNKLSTVFKEEVYFGNVVPLEGNSLKFIVKQTFNNNLRTT
jgi:hypothetical protein